jgi:glycerol-3-phosphate O-acyltransferase
MSDVRSFGRDRASIAEAVIARVGGNRAEVAAIVDEIAGDFIAPLHGAAIALLQRGFGPAFGGTFDERIEVDGDLAGLRAIAERSTLILAPTHASNLDSLVLGTVTARAGLPPFAYASGKHIYRNRVFGQLIRRLGGYKLDPDRRDRLYLRVVNIYVHELLSRGYHSMIFPSGTRGRSGEVESKIKLGLLGAAVHVAGPVTLVPVTINYQVVLEADHLIAYYLAGRSHERIVGDEMFVWGRLRATARRLRALDQRVAIRFGDPIDPHALGSTWRSRLVEQITAAYRRHTVFFATHVAARALSDAPISAVLAEIAAARAALQAHPDAGRLWPGLAHLTDREVLDAALAAWRSWHPTPPAALSGAQVAITNRDLLRYYRNRTAHIA